MAVTTGSLLSADTVKANRDETPLQAALVLFTITGTYAQANGSQLLAVDAFIQNQRRDGKAITLISAVLWQPAFDTSSATQGLLLCAYDIAITGSNITFNISENASPGVVDVSTQYADATALPSMGSPMGFLVTFTEAGA
jgi:hypothetical protein